MMKFMALTLYLLARITLALILSSAIILCFQKVTFQGFNLVIRNFELPSILFYALRYTSVKLKASFCLRGHIKKIP